MPRKAMWIIIVVVMFSTLLSSYWMMSVNNSQISQTGLTLSIDYQMQVPVSTVASFPALDSFVRSVVSGDANQVVGIYVPGTLAFPTVQQPSDNPNFVSTQPDTVTQFNAASRFNTIGLLAHNFLAGAEFYNLKMQQVVIVVYGDGHLSYYRINEIQEYQALTPESPHSDFIDLNDASGTKMTAGDLFNRVYTRGDQVVLQTCIQRNGNSSWGRIFIIATPLRINSTLQQAPLRSRIASLF